MKFSFDREAFGRELPGWALRGVLCAAPSAFWAVLGEFQHPSEIAAMVLVTALYITGFAWLSAGEFMAATSGRRTFVQALKMSAWIKPATIVFLGSAGAIFSGRVLNPEPWFAAMTPDMVCGLGSVSLVSWLAGMRELGVARLDSFAWTALTTLVQGTLISGLLAMLAVILFVWWRAWGWLRSQLEISPTRIAG